MEGVEVWGVDEAMRRRADNSDEHGAKRQKSFGEQSGRRCHGPYFRPPHKKRRLMVKVLPVVKVCSQSFAHTVTGNKHSKHMGSRLSKSKSKSCVCLSLESLHFIKRKFVNRCFFVVGVMHSWRG